MKITISHEINTDADTFWTKLFFDREFNRALHLDRLRFPDFEVIEEKDLGDTVVRTTRAVPKQDAPAVIQKLVGAKFSYTEHGTFDKKRQRYKFRVVTSSMADKVKTEGEMHTEAVGPKKIRRVVEMTIDVKIFGVGGMVEGFVSKSSQESYAEAAAFTNQWIAQKGL